jgi:hypothetical protein
MPSHYHDDEYKGSEHATDIFRAPKKEKTAGQKLEESGEFIQDPEKEDLSQQVNYSTMEENYARERRPGFDREMEAIGKADRAGNLTDQERIEAHKRAKRIRDAEDEIDPETGWPMYLARGPLWLLKKYGQLENFLDDQVGIPGTDIDWYHARQKILKPAYETHLALGILGDIFLPTSIDLASWGSMYIPNRFRQAGKVGLRTWASITKAGKTADDINIAKKGAEKFANLQGKDVEKVWQQEGLMMAIKPDPDDLPTNVVPGNIPRPLPGRQHVSGMIPRIQGKFNGKQFTGTTLDPNLEIPWNLVRDPQEKGRKIAGFFVDQASNPQEWNRLNRNIKGMMERRFPGWDLPLRRGQTPIGGWAGHHSAPVKQMAWSVNGLNNAAREEAANYMAKKIGQRLGYSPENLDLIPAEFHVYIHRMLNDAMGRYDVSNIERIMNLEPGSFSKLELWDRKPGFDLIADNIIQSKKDIYTFMTSLANQSKRTDVSPEVLVDSMEELLDLQNRIRLKPGDKNLTQIINKFLGRSDAAIDFVEDQIPAAERPIKNILYRLALEDLDKAKAFIRSRRGGTPGGLDLSPGMFPDD